MLLSPPCILQKKQPLALRTKNINQKPKLLVLLTANTFHIQEQLSELRQNPKAPLPLMERCQSALAVNSPSPCPCPVQT